jgi:hypothetical protein
MTEETTTRTTVPAAPGWYVVLFIEGDDGDWDLMTELEPVLAWEIVRHEGPYRDPARRGDTWAHYATYPLTLNGCPSEDGNQWAVKHPNGVFEMPQDQSFANEAALLAEFKRRKAALDHDNKIAAMVTKSKG